MPASTTNRNARGSGQAAACRRGESACLAVAGPASGERESGRFSKRVACFAVRRVGAVAFAGSRRRGWFHPPAPGREQVSRFCPGAKRQSERRWCGRGDLNPHEPCGSTDFLTVYGFRRLVCRADKFAVWTIPSPCSGRSPEIRCCPSSLYTFPADSSRLGLARDCQSKGFPEFGQFYFVGFPTSTQFYLSPLRLPFRHARVVAVAY
jgi:hypothetical protein